MEIFGGFAQCPKWQYWRACHHLQFFLTAKTTKTSLTRTSIVQIHENCHDVHEYLAQFFLSSHRNWPLWSLLYRDSEFCRCLLLDHLIVVLNDGFLLLFFRLPLQIVSFRLQVFHSVERRLKIDLMHQDERWTVCIVYLVINCVLRCLIMLNK